MHWRIRSFVCVLWALRMRFQILTVPLLFRIRINKFFSWIWILREWVITVRRRVSEIYRIQMYVHKTENHKIAITLGALSPISKENTYVPLPYIACIFCYSISEKKSPKELFCDCCFLH
jgi:hypothetical protein